MSQLYAKLSIEARALLQRQPEIEVPNEALGVSFLNVGWAPRLAADLRASWRRNDRDGTIVFRL